MNEHSDFSPGIILISDIHSNMEALEAVSNDMPRLPIYCTGDLVGYGADPTKVVQWMQKRKVRSVMGNHDYATYTGDTHWFNSNAEAAIEWTRTHIGEAEKEYLGKLPHRMEAEIDGVKILFVHGSPTDPLFEYVHPATHEHLFNAYLTRYQVNIVAMGHTHLPFIWEGRKGHLLNPGSVGQPRGGSPDASYIILKIKDQQVKFEHRIVPYDVNTAAAKIREANLPEYLATRLSRGV